MPGRWPSRATRHSPANESLYIDGPAGTTRDIIGSTLGLLRWGIELGTSAAEAGSNAGSDFAIDRYNDAGTLIDQPLKINRATGSRDADDAGEVSADHGAILHIRAERTAS